MCLLKHTPTFLCVFSPISVLNQRGSPGGRGIQLTSSSCGSGTASCCRWPFCTSWDGPLSCESSARGASQKAVQKKPEFRGQRVPGANRREEGMGLKKEWGGRRGFENETKKKTPNKTKQEEITHSSSCWVNTGKRQGEGGYIAEVRSWELYTEQIQDGNVITVPKCSKKMHDFVDKAVTKGLKTWK